MNYQGEHVDLAFNSDFRLQALVINQKGYIIAFDGGIVNESILNIYDNITAEDYLEAFLTMHLYNNSINNALYKIYNDN